MVGGNLGEQILHTPIPGFLDAKCVCMHGVMFSLGNVTSRTCTAKYSCTCTYTITSDRTMQFVQLWTPVCCTTGLLYHYPAVPPVTSQLCPLQMTATIKMECVEHLGIRLT